MFFKNSLQSCLGYKYVQIFLQLKKKKAMDEMIRMSSIRIITYYQSSYLQEELVSGEKTLSN
jgi:hypothetical protein